MERLKKFFMEDLGEIIGAYFDGEKIFLVRLDEKFETAEILADSAEPEDLAKKIAAICIEKGWQTNAVGFCLQSYDVTAAQIKINAVPEKEIQTMVKTWAEAHVGMYSAFSFKKIGEELWLEVLPEVRVRQFLQAFAKFGMKLQGLSMMPNDSLEKKSYERAKFIAEIIREKNLPNFLVVERKIDWKKIILAACSLLMIVLMIFSLKIPFGYKFASDELKAEKILSERLNEKILIKISADEITQKIRRSNELALQVNSALPLNLLMKIGEISGEDLRLTKIRSDRNFLEMEGEAATTDALKKFLGRVENSAQLEKSTEDGGKIFFVIRAALK